MKTVLIAARISVGFQHFLEGKNYILTDVLSPDVEGIVTSNKLKLDHSAIDNFPHLKWIARLGSGMEIIDTDYCREKNIHCFSSPAGIANSVAEHAMGMLLNWFHHIGRSHQEIHDGLWLREENRGIELENKCVGIIGYGHTGKAFAHKLQAFTKHILVYDKYLHGYGTEHVKETGLEEIMDQADILSFHVPLNEETTHYYNDSFLSMMKKKHVLLNTSRGAVCCTGTILRGLEEGHILGACLDVLEEEKNIQNILQQKGNVIEKLLSYPTIITPHIAGYSMNAIEKMCAELQRQLETCLL